MRERLAVSKQAAQKIDMERFNLKKLNKFAALENLEDGGDINRAWDNIRVKIKISAKVSLGYCDPKHRKPWFDENCSELVD
jgi:hypothetical protein